MVEQILKSLIDAMRILSGEGEYIKVWDNNCVAVDAEIDLVWLAQKIAKELDL